MIMSPEIQIRFANSADLQELTAMQALSFRVLGAPYYGFEVVEAFIEVGTMDAALLDDGTYFVAMAERRIVGCGGWSRRVPSYAAFMSGGTAVSGMRTATVRAVYVHPDFARRGIARAVMTTIEAEIAASGFVTASLAATLSGIPLYRRLGYQGEEPIILRLPSGHKIITLGMTKSLAVGTLRSVA
jgi:GNAT superfamily N-acetyltransferase